jgi:hypothetical protein
VYPFCHRFLFGGAFPQIREEPFFLPYVLRHLDRPPRRGLFVMMVLLARCHAVLAEHAPHHFSRGHSREEGIDMRFGFQSGR